MGFDPDSLRMSGTNGWLGMLVAEDAGGAGLGATELALVMQEAGRALAPEPIAEVALAGLIISGAPAAARNPLLQQVMSGELVVIPAFQEPSAGLDLADTMMSAMPRDGEWRLSGRKSFVSCASACDGFLVSARGGDGLLVCFVDQKAQGLTIRSVATVDGRNYGELTFDDVTAKSVMRRAGDAAAILRRYLGLMLVVTSAEILGVMEGVNDMTLEYLKTRKQFGRAIGSFQALQHRAVDNYVLIESTRSLLHQVCGGGEPVPEALASALKAAASSAALTVTKSAVQLHGAIGFTDEYDAGLFLKRAMWLSSYFGNEAVHRRRYANLS